MKPKVLIIGCGIVGQAALNSLNTSNIENFFEISVLDIFPNSKFISTLRDLDGSPAAWIPGTRISGFPGGNLNWGRNSSLVIVNDLDLWDTNFIEHVPRIARKLIQLGFPPLKFKQLSLKNFTDSFIVHENRPTSMTDWMKILKFNDSLEILNGTALRIRRLGNSRLEIKFRDTDNSEDFMEVDFVLICAGSIGTQELLANSEIFQALPTHILDHASFKMGEMLLEKVALGKKGLFGWNRFDVLNDKLCFTYLDRNKHYLWTVRLFPKEVLGLSDLARLLSKRFKSNEYKTLTQEFFLGLASFISGRILHAGIDIEITLDFLNREDGLMVAAYSDSNRIEFLEYPFQKIDIPEGVFQYINEIFEKYKLGRTGEIKYLQTKEILVDELTSSSHHMSTVINSSEMNLEFTEVSRNVHVAGASIFPGTVPGHPTFLGAVTALFAVEKILEKIKASLTSSDL